jgi:hypothetical protein
MLLRETWYVVVTMSSARPSGSRFSRKRRMLLDCASPASGMQGEIAKPWPPPLHPGE